MGVVAATATGAGWVRGLRVRGFAGVVCFPCGFEGGVVFGLVVALGATAGFGAAAAVDFGFVAAGLLAFGSAAVFGFEAAGFFGFAAAAVFELAAGAVAALAFGAVAALAFGAVAAFEVERPVGALRGFGAGADVTCGWSWAA